MCPALLQALGCDPCPRGAHAGGDTGDELDQSSLQGQAEVRAKKKEHARPGSSKFKSVGPEISRPFAYP